MILYCNSRSLADIRDGKATTISVSVKPFTMNNEIPLYTEDEALGLAQARMAVALEKIAEAIERGMVSVGSPAAKSGGSRVPKGRKL